MYMNNLEFKYKLNSVELKTNKKNMYYANKYFIKKKP